MPPEYIQQLSSELSSLMVNYVGRNGKDSATPTYLPPSALRKFWKRKMVNRALLAYPTLISERPDSIMEHFLLVFSLLVYLGRLKHLKDFTQYNLQDSSFPLEEFPHIWPTTPIYKSLFKKIKEHQWIFFPLTFYKNKLYGQTLCPQHILPICDEKVIKNGDTVTVCKITVDKDSTNFGQTTFVRKSYDHRSLDHYEREKRAFTSLESHESSHIVRFHGSFCQKREDPLPPTYNLILEYVDGGNLEEFFANMEPPQTPSETIQFWGAFVGIIEALFLFHLSKNDPHNHIQGIHQDIKPENILVSKQSSGRPFDVTLKLTDFGLSHTQTVEHDARELPGVDSRGGPTYGAPECSHHAPYTIRGMHPITTEADIFSIGCVLSDAAAWVFKGEEGREEYRKARKLETSKLETFDGSGHDECFHDGITALQAVSDTHKMIISERSAENVDFITPQILEVVQDHMLVRKDKRWAAKELRERFGKIIQDARAGIESSPTQLEAPEFLPCPESEIHSPQNDMSTASSPTTNGASFENNAPFGYPTPIQTPSKPEPSTMSDSTNNNREYSPTQQIVLSPNALTPRSSKSQDLFLFEHAKAYIDAKKSGRRVSFNHERIMSKLKNNLKDRDHIFFIDTSETMFGRIEELLEAFKVFAYIAKQIDTDGVELYFSADPSKRHKGTTTTLQNRFDAQDWDQVTFEDKFTKFIEKRIIPRLYSKLSKVSSQFAPKSLNIFVFTDGHWGINKEKAAGIENPIKRIITEIQERKLNRTQAVIQFIRFGDDIDGQRYLSYLDELGKEFDCDLVDTKLWSGNLFEMFLGAIDPEIDERGESASGSGTPKSTTSSPTANRKSRLE